MAFGIQTSSGNGEDFLPLMTYNAKAGRVKLVQRAEINGEWVKQEADVTASNPVFVFDLAAVQVGWLLFKAGMAPIKAMAPVGHALPANPIGDYGLDERGKAIKPKQGFVLHVLDKDGVKREFASNSMAVVGVLDDLHTAYMAAPESKQGLLPVVQFTGATEIKSKHGSNYSPDFKIVRWAPRPAALAGVASAPAPQPVQPPVAMPPPGAGPTGALIGDEMPFGPEFR